MAFAITITHDRQQFVPLPSGAVSVWLRQALICWAAVMCIRSMRWTSSNLCGSDFHSEEPNATTRTTKEARGSAQASAVSAQAR